MVHGDIVVTCYSTCVLSSQALSLILITGKGLRSHSNPGVVLIVMDLSWGYAHS